MVTLLPGRNGKANSLFQSNNITPSCCRVLALEVMLDGIGEHLSLALAILLSVLLCANHDGFRAITLIDTIYHLIQPVHFLNLFRIEVK